MKNLFTLFPTIFVIVTFASGQTVTDTIKPTPSNSQFVYVYDQSPTQGYPNTIQISAGYNTVSGVYTQSRTYIYFDLTNIPTNANIISASLNLFFDSLINPTTYSGSPGQNGTMLSMVNQPWSQDSLTWNNQPTVSASDTVIVGPTSGIRTNITNINVDTPIQMWVTNPSINYGWRFWQISEYNVQESQEDFASSYDTLRPDKMPTLVVTYTTPNGIVNVSTESTVNVYPSPANNQVTISAPFSICSISIYDLIGNELKVIKAAGTNFTTDISNLEPGVYIFRVTDLYGHIANKKISKYK